jgi:hypothetical protein
MTVAAVDHARHCSGNMAEEAATQPSFSWYSWMNADATAER